MQRLLCCFLLGATLISCGTQTEKPLDNKPLNETQRKAQVDQQTVTFGGMVQIDSSIYVMYPLVLDDEISGGISSSVPSPTYWNIVFYNTATGASHLLDARKMVINSYTSQESSASRSSFDSYSVAGFDKYIQGGYQQVDKLLYYLVKVKDYNKDGELNGADPSYLFVSDKAGQHFKQISPDDVHVDTWEASRETNKIFIRAVQDANNDKKFDEEDVTIPMVYDPKSPGFAKEVLGKDFKTKVKMLFRQQWPKHK